MREIDPKIVKKAQRGDRLAFDRIISTYREIITSVCFKYMRNAEEAMDMAQEVFCAAYTQLEKFEFKSKISTWLYRIAANLCINRLDALKRRKYFVTESIHADSETEKTEIVVVDSNLTPDREMEATETRELILSELESFPKEEKNLVILRDLQGLEYGEISKVLRIPLGSVKSKLSRARDKIKKKLLRKIGG